MIPRYCQALFWSLLHSSNGFPVAVGSGGQQDGCSHCLVDAVDSADGLDLAFGATARLVEPCAMAGASCFVMLLCVFCAWNVIV